MFTIVSVNGTETKSPVPAVSGDWLPYAYYPCDCLVRPCENKHEQTLHCWWIALDLEGSVCSTSCIPIVSSAVKKSRELFHSSPFRYRPSLALFSRSIRCTVAIAPGEVLGNPRMSLPRASMRRATSIACRESILSLGTCGLSATNITSFYAREILHLVLPLFHSHQKR